MAKQDVQDYVAWGIDHLKVDGCWEFDYEFMNESYAVRQAPTHLLITHPPTSLLICSLI